MKQEYSPDDGPPPNGHFKYIWTRFILVHGANQNPYLGLHSLTILDLIKKCLWPRGIVSVSTPAAIHKTPLANKAYLPYRFYNL